MREKKKNLFKHLHLVMNDFGFEPEVGIVMPMGVLSPTPAHTSSAPSLHALGLLRGIAAFLVSKLSHRHQEQSKGYQKGKVGGRTDREFGSNTHILLYVKQRTNKHLLHSTGN